jgi:L-alanine-DL-glutamate epimerase-like enolase superfamily enzyme
MRDGAPVVGYGFNSNGRYGQGALIRDRLLPRLLEARPADLLDETGSNLDPFRIWTTVMRNEKPGGHGERSVAVGALDMAVWDAVAKIANKPLYRLLAERFGKGMPDEKVWVYAAGGYYYPDRDRTALQDEMRGYLDRGYKVVKMKIGGASLAEDLKRIEAVLAVVGSGRNLAVDANGRFDLPTALAYAASLEPYDLLWYEEAGDPLDYALQAQLSATYRGATATGENLFSHQDARNLLRYGGMDPQRDWLQFDCALSYGLVEYLRTLEVLKQNGWSTRRVVPHGGHQMSLNIAAGLHLGGNESYPDVFYPFGGFADECAVVDGHIRLPDRPGVGFEAKADLYALLRQELH